ncbi:MAG: hypothetical protein V1809_05715 [Planctomycetota bacterium]
MDKTTGTRDEKSLFQQILQHDELSRQLDLAGGPENAGHIFDEILALEDDILAVYGLPNTLDNRKVLREGYNSREPAWQVAERTIATLASLRERVCVKFEGRAIMKTAEQYDREALALFNKDKFLDAAEVLREGIEHYPDDLHLLWGRLSCLFFAKEYPDVVRAYGEYRRHGGDYPLADIRCAAALDQMGKFKEAREIAQGIPDGTIANFTADMGSELIGFLVELQDPVEGLRASRILARAHPKVAEFRFAIGYWSQKRTGRSLAACLPYIRQAVRMDPKRYEYRDYYANLLFDLGREKQALAEWEFVPVESCDNWLSLLRRIRLYRAHGRRDDARRCRASLREMRQKNDLRKVLDDTDFLGKLTGKGKDSDENRPTSNN